MLHRRLPERFGPSPKPSTVKALLLKEYGRLCDEEVPAPGSAPDEVLVAVKACGICGSDVHGMDGSTGRRRPPIIMGHEAAGVIARVGSRVTGWAAGDRVTFDSTIYCGQCAFCRRGMINLCDHRRVLGVSCEDYRQNGAFAEFVAVPQHILYRLPDGLAFEHAALVEPFAIALHAVRRAPPRLNDTRRGCGRGDDRPGAGASAKPGRLRTAHRGGHRGATDSPWRQSAARRTIINSVDRRCRSRPFSASRKGWAPTLPSRPWACPPPWTWPCGCLRKGGAATLVGNVTPKIEFPLQTAVTRELTLYGSCASQGRVSGLPGHAGARRVAAPPR